MSARVRPARVYLRELPEVLADARRDLGALVQTLGDLWPLTWKIAAWREQDEEGLRSFQEGRTWERARSDGLA
jgi:hypothetical protein